MKNGLLIVCLFLIAFSGCFTNKKTASGRGADTASAAVDTTALAAAVPLTYEQQQGKNLYDLYCAVCHGSQGAGDGFNSFNLNPKPHSLADSAYVAGFTDQDLKQIISQGGRGRNMSVEMPGYRGTLTPLGIAYLSTYVRWLGEGHAAR